MESAGIVDTLVDIGQKAKELNTAFRLSNDIYRKLMEYLSTAEENDLLGLMGGIIKYK